ncbi:hypothetical protein ACH5BF_07815 [Arcobacter sp. YIC-464]|uniref:hypothetical protein n=1 Tax=Arcobacter sp. YIC-464 TaxID=3376631 RepID=UPI003C1F42AA
MDSDVIIELYQKNELNSILCELHTCLINVYIPKDISSIDNFKAELVSVVNQYITDGYLQELTLNISNSEVYEELSKFPFDEGELFVYSLADTHELLVISNDKISAYSYLVYKNHTNLQYGTVSTDELLENFYSESKVLKTRRMSNYKFLQLLGYNVSDIQRITKSKRRQQEWFKAKEIAIENKKILAMFSSEKNFYTSIGSLASSIYALDRTTDNRKFDEDEHYKMNIGLKIKSTSKDIKNTVLTRKIKAKPHDYWEYNNIAYNAIIKYMKHSNFLIPLLDNSGNNKYIGTITEEEYQTCISFTAKFRNLFDKYRISV